MDWMATLKQRLRDMPPDLRWLVVAVLVAALPHFLHLPLWISVLFCLLIIWRLAQPLPAARGRAPGFPLLRLISSFLILISFINRADSERYFLSVLTPGMTFSTVWIRT